MKRKSKKLGVKIEKSTVPVEESLDSTKNEAEGDSSKLHKICTALDNLTLDALCLMERFMKRKLDLEKIMTDGELHLAKSRYIMGHRNVSTLQLPTENSDNISAEATITEVSKDETMFGKPYLELNIQDKVENSINEDGNKTKVKNGQNPIKWFGVLVPQDLRAAQTKYKDALALTVECANIQIRLHQTYLKISQLKLLKRELKENIEE